MNRDVSYREYTEWIFKVPYTRFLPFVHASYIEKYDLWDSSWLKKKYPKRFNRVSYLWKNI